MYRQLPLIFYKIFCLLLAITLIFAIVGCSTEHPGTKPIITAEDALENEQSYRLKAPYTQVW